MLVLPLGGVLAILLAARYDAERYLVGGLWQRVRFLRGRSQGEAFGVFYTATIGAGALAPIVFGSLTDRIGLWPMTVCVACTALITLPLALSLPASSHEGGG